MTLDMFWFSLAPLNMQKAYADLRFGKRVALAEICGFLYFQRIIGSRTRQACFNLNFTWVKDSSSSKIIYVMAFPLFQVFSPLIATLKVGLETHPFL